MWRNTAKQLSSRTSKTSKTKVISSNNKGNSLSAFSSSFRFLGFSKDSIFNDNFESGPRDCCSSVLNVVIPEKGIRKVWKFADFWGRLNMHILECNVNPNGLLPKSCSRNYSSVAEEMESHSTDVEEMEVGVSCSNVDEDVSVVEVDEVKELLAELKKQERRQSSSEPLRNYSGMDRSKYNALRRRQVKIETEVWEQATNEYKELVQDMCRQSLVPNLPYIKSLFLGWFEPLQEKIAEEQNICMQVKCKATTYGRFFRLLPPDKMAVVTMHKLTATLMCKSDHSHQSHGYTSLVHAACEIGDAIEQEVRIHKFLEKKKKKKKKKKDGVSNALEEDESSANALEEDESSANAQDQEKLKKTVTKLIQRQKGREANRILKRREYSKPWSKETRAWIGCRLIELLLQTAYIQRADQVCDGSPEIRPAFVHKKKTVIKKSMSAHHAYGIIQCDPLILKGLSNTARHMVIPYMPMLIPPVQWTGYDKGAHLFLPSYVMRTHGAKQQRDVVKCTPKTQLEPVLEALDILGSTKWRVNKRVLNVIDRIWATGGRLGDLIDHEDIPLPEEPDTDDEAVVKKWRWKVNNVKKENRERYSQRCDTELKLAVARKMKDEEGFYYPHNLDFRGRAYPMHPHLNHLGSDVCRGILEFAEGRPLGESGLRWLKIHLANLYGNGVDKLSLEGRITFTESHLDEIFDSTDSPLEGERWWLNAEDPFQCLAVCINLTEALRSTSPETTISHIPVHQDGSCNGLQHYAALGRDKIGAAAVNLVAGEKPSDVYSDIATRVLEVVRRDAKKDPTEFPDAMHARLLINQVDRKLVKQTVMTSVYGVTYIGARDQIKRRLNERNAIGDDAELFGAACYAAKITLKALGEMFEAARSIMNWMGECAKIIASENEPVRWTTPLGLPVVQPYRQAGRCSVRTSLQQLSLRQETDKVMVKRQRTAFPPNFVHSLDSSHMMMTALAAKKAGLNFAGVHDSYWTHACDVDELNRILREKFVELYETPILENLLESFQKPFPSLAFPPLPERGDFDIKEVLTSPYFFN